MAIEFPTDTTAITPAATDLLLIADATDSFNTYEVSVTDLAAFISAATAFTDLTDTPGSYTTANALLTTNGTPNALIETTVILTEPATNQFQLTAGATDFLVTADCTIDQNLATTSSVDFAQVKIGGSDSSTIFASISSGSTFRAGLFKITSAVSNQLVCNFRQEGLGTAIKIEGSNVSNTNPVLKVANAGSGEGIEVVNNSIQVNDLALTGGIVQTDVNGLFSSSVTLPSTTLCTTQTPGTNNTTLASTAYVDAAVATADTFIELTDTPSGYTTANALYTTNGTPNAIIETTVILTEGANTFNISVGTASLDIANDGTVTTIAGTAGDYFRIGDAGTTSRSLDFEDDLLITGELEVDGEAFFDGQVLVGTNALATDFVNAEMIVSQGDTGFILTHNAAIIAEAITPVGTETAAVIGLTEKILNATNSWGLFGSSETNGSGTAGGIKGQALVKNTGDTGAAHGGSFFSNSTHAGGDNIAIFLQAQNGANNYAIQAANGGVQITDLNTANGILQTDASGNFSSSVTLPDGTLGTTQGPSDNSTNIATTAYVDAAVATADTFIELTDTPGSYTTANALLTTNGTPNALIETTVILTEGVNTFNMSVGTASLDIAAGSTLNVDANLTVESTSIVNQDLTTDANVTFQNLNLAEETSQTSGLLAIITLEHTTTATPANGIGLEIIYSQETSAGNVETIGSTACLMDDVTLGNEDAIFKWYLMTAGVARTEKMSLNSVGDLTIAGDLIVGTSNALTDSAGVLTLQNIDALDATTEATIESAIDTLSLTSLTLTGITDGILYTNNSDVVTELALGNADEPLLSGGLTAAPIFGAMRLGNAIVSAAGVTPVDTDVSSWNNDTVGIVKGTGGRIFITFKNATDVYYVEATAL